MNTKNTYLVSYTDRSGDTFKTELNARFNSFLSIFDRFEKNGSEVTSVVYTTK
jgi:hypothetical protein